MPDWSSLSLASERCSPCGIITRKIICIYVLHEGVATNCMHSANIHSSLYANYFRSTNLCYKNSTDTPKTDFISIRSRQTNTVGFSCHRQSSCSCLTLHNCRHLWLSEQFKYCKWNSVSSTGPSPAPSRHFCTQHNGRIYRF